MDYFQVFSQHRHSKDLQLGEVFAVCGYFLGVKYLQVAMDIFQEVDNRHGLVDVLYNMGEKTQFDPDISKCDPQISKGEMCPEIPKKIKDG